MNTEMESIETDRNVFYITLYFPEKTGLSERIEFCKEISFYKQIQVFMEMNNAYYQILPSGQVFTKINAYHKWVPFTGECPFL